ncbi:3'-5' exonuclease [Fluviicoccus keumensis]|uniref:3'-5' exonuclease n=1 Tax=Fluviicoccus keumensis TaxID=1435465 RepID=UPI0013EE68D7|nr:3'-5' exonuclease [Fluviicoccus keumensis]
MVILPTPSPTRTWKFDVSVNKSAPPLLTKVLYLDTETTGLDEGAEIIEIAILDVTGNVLLDSLVKPTSPISDAASKVHGIMMPMLDDAPSWKQLACKVKTLLDGQIVVAHNAEFDARMILQSCLKYGVTGPANVQWICTMKILTTTNGGKWPSLSQARALLRDPILESNPDNLHRARHDAEVCRKIHQALLLEQPELSGLHHHC